MVKLNEINCPGDLKKMNLRDLQDLPPQIRDEIIQTVSENGGHLASNLGNVELTIAIHKVFHAPEDKILWDVGHQSYTHKLLTGRQAVFKTLRKTGGLCGFPKRGESEYDCFDAGHSGTALSAAMGFEVGNRILKKDDHRVVAVIGDGSLTCGITLEAMNLFNQTCPRLILIVNDNKMSIDHSQGAISKILNHVITANTYNHFKRETKKIVAKAFGKRGIRAFHKLLNAVKSLFTPPDCFFEQFGLRYIGPVNGHDLPKLIRALESAKHNDSASSVVHVITKKGCGYKFAEENPEKFHGIGPFDVQTGEEKKKCGKPGFSAAFGDALTRVVAQNDNVVSVVAAMAYGCGIPKSFTEDYKDTKFFDVGIAEEHALIYAAGLAAAGCRPVVSLYATFAQRALDCIYHDVCLQNLPVILCEDRAGLVEDGPTHHGIYDVSFLRAMPNLSILAAACEAEIEPMLLAALQRNSPVVIRYPRGCSPAPEDFQPAPLTWGKAEVRLPYQNSSDSGRRKISLWCAGNEVWTGLECADILKKRNCDVSVINVRFLKPFDTALLEQFAKESNCIVSLEDHVKQGGLATILAENLCGIHSPDVSCCRLMSFGWDSDTIIRHGSIADIRREYGLTPDAIAAQILGESKRLPTDGVIKA